MACLHTGTHARSILPHILCKSLSTPVTRHDPRGLSLKRQDRRFFGFGGNATSARVTPWWPPRSQKSLSHPGTPLHLRGYATILDDRTPPPGKVEFPFPPHAHPTPHEIFHLPRAATQAQIKARYYQLVRYHHPDSQHCRRLPGEQAHARFQKIVAAYDYLRGATSSPHPGAKRYGFDSGHSHFDPYLHELARRRRAQRAAYANRHWSEGFGARKEDDFDQNGSKERTILVFGVLALVIGLYPSFVLFPFHLQKNHKAAVVNLTQARNDAREMGEQRRTEIRKRVEGMQRGTVPMVAHSEFGGIVEDGNGSSSSVGKA
ncbi:hypothetical protein FA13DRAFT_1632780 [Coprinellus micaceus]|uniref:J domain-containing protein n=1 Tax=Coprinellus micaceus TaxID=71717 RepID=A0A4Y7T3V2_COPMI|nr:hypothetical protein FA13DRAFT_1632780 [Coprinellus micaceus]